MHPPPPLIVTNINNERRPNYFGELKFKKNPRPPMELDGSGFRVYIYIYITHVGEGWICT
jgi:hypothetical protein